MSSLFRILFEGGPRKRLPAKAIRRGSVRPTLEQLEDRTVPSAFHVMNLNDAGPGSLRAAVLSAKASPGSTIDFAAGLTGTISLKSALRISAGMEIDGPGAASITLSGRHLNLVVQTSTTAPVTIAGLTIADGLGGGIYNAVAPLTLSRVTFANNQSTNGGALYSEFATTTITDCLFTGNRAVQPPTPGAMAFGGAITSVGGTLTVTQTQFINNLALGASSVALGISTVTGVAEGGAVNCFFDAGTDVFTGCTFTGNSARGGSNDSGPAGTVRIGVGEGGAIDVVASTVEVDQTTFKSNVAQGGTTFVKGSSGFDCGEGYGGAIHVSQGGQLTANDDTLTLNRALGANFGSATGLDNENAGAGGAINAEDSGTSLYLAGDVFSSNTAMGGVTGYLTDSGGRYGGNGKGGAIYLRDASADVSGSTFSGNVALAANATGDATGGTALGGAIRSLRGELTIDDFTQFNNNRAQGGNGGPSAGSGGDADGGALSAQGGVVNLWDLTLTANRAIGGIGQGGFAHGGFAYGGGIFLLDTITTADDLTVQSNLALGGLGANAAFGGDADGGGIYEASDISVTIGDSQITLNNAQGGLSTDIFNLGGGFGGGIADSDNPVLSLPNTTVAGNTASTMGDDVYP